MAVCWFYTTVFPEKTRLGNPLLGTSGCRCYSILMLRTSEPFSGLIYKQRKHETFYYIERFRAFLLPFF